MAPRKTPAENAELTKKLKAGYAAGKSIREMSKEHGVSFGKVHRMLSEANVTFRSRGGANRAKK